MKIENSPILAQANLLTQSRYNFTVIEKRAVYFIIQEVRKRFTNNDLERTVFDDLVIRLDAKSMMKGYSKLDDIYKALTKLRQRSININDKNRALELGYINYYDHDKRTSVIEIQVSKKILPYLVLLSKEFTSYSLIVAISLKNKYSQRFYEYCSQFKTVGGFQVSIEELREKLKITEKYPRYALLKTYVLEPAKKELKKMYDKNESDLYFNYSETKEGRTVKGLKIAIITKEANENKETLKIEDMVYYLRVWLSSWLNADQKPKNKAFIDKTISELNKDPQKIEKLYKRLFKLQKEKTNLGELAAMARHIIVEDYLE